MSGGGGPSLAAELSDLMRVRHTHGAERHALLSQIAHKLALKYLRNHAATPEESSRVLTVLAHFAEKQPGAFGWGDPAKIGTTALGLVEQLAVERGEHHFSVLSAIANVLQLLCFGCARTFACFAHDALALLSKLGRDTLSTCSCTLHEERNASCTASEQAFFVEFAQHCGEHVAPVRLNELSEVRCAWLQCGLLVVCAQQHVIAPGFLSDGGPVLWGNVLQALNYQTLPELPEPVRLSPLRALQKLLQHLDAPKPLRSRLMHHLLLLLCCHTSNDPKSIYASEQQGHGDVRDWVRAPAPLPSFRSFECDEIIGECLECLVRPGLAQTLASLALLRVAVPWALEMSCSSRLHAILCQLLSMLPIEALAPELHALERFLGVCSLQHALLPCFEAGLKLCGDARSASLVDAESRATTSLMGISAVERKQRLPEDDRNTEPLTKRQRGDSSSTARAIVEKVHTSLYKRAMSLHMQGSTEDVDKVSLSTLGAITCLLTRCRPLRASAEETPLNALVLRLVESIEKVIDLTISTITSISNLADVEHKSSLLCVAFNVSRDLVSNLRSQCHLTSSIVLDKLYTTISRLSTLPWTPSQKSADVVESTKWTAHFGNQICCDALHLITLIPPKSETKMRAQALHAAIEAGMVSKETELPITAHALELLPQLVDQLSCCTSKECTLLFEALGCLMGACPLSLYEALAKALGQLACLYGRRSKPETPARNEGDSHVRGLRCELCDGSADERNAVAQYNLSIRSRDRMIDDSSNVEAEAMQARLSRWIARVWEMQQGLPIDDGKRRSALVECVARMVMHAHPTQLARLGSVLVQLMALLGDEDDGVRTACSKLLPRLLGSEPIVRVVLHLAEDQPLSGEVLRVQLLRPMIEAMRERRADDPEVMLCMMATLGSVCCEALFASDECLASGFREIPALCPILLAVVLALCDGLDVGRIDQEYGLAMQQLTLLARSCAEPKGTTVAMCRRLVPLLASEWGWWVQERPHLLHIVSGKLLDCTQRELAQLIAPHALPHIVVLGGLALLYSDCSAVLSPVERARGAHAIDVLQTLATWLDRGMKQLLVENMHMILAEVFSRQAGDDSYDENDVNLINASLEFVYSCGVSRKEHLTAMIRMNSRELMQNMALRLGRAQEDVEIEKVLMALNLLIPAGLHAGDDELSCNAVSLMNSVDVNGSNTHLRVYIDANSLMLIQFLRNKLTSRSALIRDKKVALNALDRLLMIMKDEGGVPFGWWGEMVATLKLALKQDALQTQALTIVASYAALIHQEQLGLCLQQLVLMLLPYLKSHTTQVVQVLEHLIVEKANEGSCESLGRALTDITFMPDHPALDKVHAVLQAHVRQPGLRQRLKGALRGLAHESAALRLMALQQLLDALQRTPDEQLFSFLLSTSLPDAELISKLLHELLRCCGECHNAASSSSASQVKEFWQPAADLAMQCLGELTAIDPSRVSVRQPTRTASRWSATARETGLVSDEELCARLLERFLVKTLRGAYEGQVSSAAYSCTVLLQDICKCSSDTPYHLESLADVAPQDKQPRRPQDEADLFQRLGIRPVQGRAAKFWSLLQESTRHTMRPFLQLRAVLPPKSGAENDLAPIFRRGIRYSEWLVRWSRQLLQRTTELRERGQLNSQLEQRAQLLLACEPCFDFDHHLALHLLPYLMLLLLTVDREGSVQILHSEVNLVLINMISISEIPLEESDLYRAHEPAADESEAQLCCMAIFNALDRLHEWRGQQRKRGDWATVDCVDALLQSISHVDLATAALECSAHCRSLLYMEQSVGNATVDPKRFLSGHRWELSLLSFDDASRMHKAYVRTDEPDGLLALTKLRRQPTPEEEVLEHESNGQYSAALNCYQLILQQRVDNGSSRASSLLPWQLGLCRSLRCMGLFVSMRDSAERMLRSAPSERERYHLRPCALQAAWRLGEWDDVRRLLASSPAPVSLGGMPISAGGGSGISGYETELARALLAFHNHELAAIQRHCTEARMHLVPLIAAAGMESYGRAHVHVTQLHALQELQAAAHLLDIQAETPKLVFDRAQLEALMNIWQRRIQLLPDMPQALEPILAVRCAVYRHVERKCMELLDSDSAGILRMEADSILRLARSGLAQSWLTYAKGAREAGHSERAVNALAQARIYDSFRAIRMTAETDWDAGRSNQAIMRLQQQLSMLTSEHDKSARADTLVLLARYLEHERGLSESQLIVELLSEANKLQPEWEKCQFYLGHFMDRLLTDALLQAECVEVVQHGRTPGHRSEFDKRHVTPQERLMKAADAYATYLHKTLRYYGAALRRGMKYSALALPRLLTLWLNFSDLQLNVESSGQAAKRLPAQTHELMTELMKNVPLHQWLPATSQLVSRICHRNQKVREMLHQQLAKMLADFPHQLVWAVIPTALSTVAERKRYGESIVVRAKQQLMSTAPELQDLMGQASRLIDHLRKVCNDCSMEKREKRVKMRARWPFAADAPTIERWADDVDVMGSLQRPKRVTIHGSDGALYPFLCKPKDDLRKDARMMELMTAVNRMLQKSSICRRRRLAVRCYSVVPLDQECGLIEWVPNMLQLRSIIKEYWEAYRVPFDHTSIKIRHQQASEMGGQKKVDALCTLVTSLMSEFPPMLHHWFVDTFRGPSSWFEGRLAFSRSCAVMSMIGYAVGLGDRHLENILVDSTSGALMHVDFACLFDHGLNLETPEKVPFRLTQNLLHAMGVVGADGAFRQVCELTLEQLRNNRETLLNVLSTMRHDPLVEWSKRNSREDASGAKDSEEATRELDKINQKLQGVMQLRGPTPLSVQGQVQQLIDEATDIVNLGQMYIWWMVRADDSNVPLNMFLKAIACMLLCSPGAKDYASILEVELCVSYRMWHGLNQSI